MIDHTTNKHLVLTGCKWYQKYSICSYFPNSGSSEFWMTWESPSKGPSFTLTKASAYIVKCLKKVRFFVTYVKADYKIWVKSHATYKFYESRKAQMWK